MCRVRRAAKPVNTSRTRIHAGVRITAVRAVMAAVVAVTGHAAETATRRAPKPGAPAMMPTWTWHGAAMCRVCRVRLTHPAVRARAGRRAAAKVVMVNRASAAMAEVVGATKGSAAVEAMVNVRRGRRATGTKVVSSAARAPAAVAAKAAREAASPAASRA